MYRAAAALPYDNLERATAGLCGQLRVMAGAGEATPDWSTLAIEGPTEAVGLPDRTWFEWTATVVVDGGVVGSDEALDAAIPAARRPAETLAAEETAPLSRAL